MRASQSRIPRRIRLPRRGGGLRVVISIGACRSLPRRTANSKPRSTVPPACSARCAEHSSTTAALTAHTPALPSTTRLHCVRSAACLYRNHVASGMRFACSGAVSPRSSTIAANPPACSSRSVARSAWSSLLPGLRAFRRAPRPLRALASPCSRLVPASAASRQRIHSNCLSRTPFAAADSGSNASFTSTHAHARSSACPPRHKLERQARPSRRRDSCQLADRAHRQPAMQQFVNGRNPRRRNLAYRARRR